MTIHAEPPIVVAPTPTSFDDSDSVDFSALERNVARWRTTPLSGFVLNSENGEEAFLSEAEKLEIIRTVNRAREGEKFIVAGIDNPSVKESLRLADEYVEAGAELLRIRIPRLTRNVKEYFEQVIPRAAAPVVIIHQIAPGTFLGSGVSPGASAELIGELVSLDNTFGYIMSDNLRFEARVRLFVPAEKQFWTANGSVLLTGAAAGANGGCLMLANVFPHECREVVRLVGEKKLAEAQEIQTKLVEADWQILSRGAAGIKAALNLLGYETGTPRSPMIACDDFAIEQIRSAMITAGAEFK
ncbi:MAG TPA: dihydrodipicolinate synthase family protein [Planctomycetaceae bacterium]|nr:dihydrodipicolinate synthase family protein [Planctomycetaceae bacterium]